MRKLSAVAGFVAAMSTAPAAAVAQEPPGVTYEEARSLPEAELTRRVLEQLGGRVIAIRRPREGQNDHLRLATRPLASYPHLCETQFIDVGFVGSMGPDNKLIMGRSEWVSMSPAYRIVGAAKEMQTQAEAAAQATVLDRACAEDFNFLRYFPAPDATTAEVAARAVADITGALGRAGAPKFKLTCSQAPCTAAQRANLASLKPSQITEVESRTCPGPEEETTMCVTISLLNGERRQTRPGIVEREGWSLDVIVRDPSDHLITFGSIVVEEVMADSRLVIGPDELIP